jgi:two-component system, NtrC family, sensor kinase
MTATRDDTIADLKRANAELRHERDAALAREAALAEVLDVINRSPGEPGPVFEAILDRAHRLCGAVSGSLQLYDGEAFHAVAVHGLPEPFAEWLRSRRLATADGPFSPLIEGQSSHHILDLAQLDHPAARKAVEETGSRTLLAVALRADQKLLGMILTVRNEIRAFSHQEIVLLESFADQAVIAVENARLVTEQREALEQQTATAEVLQVINASPGNLTRVFETMLDKAMQLCETSAGIFTTYDGAQLKTEAMRGLPTVYAEFRANNPLTFAPGQATSRLRDGRSVLHITDLKAEDIYKSADLHRRALVDLGGARTALLVALRKDDVWLGTFLIYRQEVRPFSDRQVALLQNFAAQAVIAMENARLLAELRARTDELAQRQNELRVTFENMADGVAMFDETPRLVAWNRKFQEIFDVPDGLLEERRTYAEYIRYLAARGDYGPGTDVAGQVRLITANTDQRRTY